jgi:hypothetical protein
MRDINHLPRVPRYHISNFNGLLSGTFCTAVTRTPITVGSCVPLIVIGHGAFHGK